MTPTSMPIRTGDRVLTALLVLATLALSAVAAGDGVLRADVRLSRWLQAHPIPFADPLIDFANTYVSGVPLSIACHAVAVVLLLRRQPGSALLVTLVAWLRVTNGLLKLVAGSPRPTPDVVTVTERATGLGFPSGHAMGATLVFGALAYLLVSSRAPSSDGRATSFHSSRGAPESETSSPSWTSPTPDRTHPTSTRLRRVGVAACLAMVLLTGYGRILVGAHWPSDVLGGWLWGTILLIAAVRIRRLMLRRRPATGEAA